MSIDVPGQVFGESNSWWNFTSAEVIGVPVACEATMIVATASIAAAFRTPSNASCPTSKSPIISNMNGPRRAVPL